MECSTKGEKFQAMKNYKRAHFLYNFVLYSLTSLITCLFFSYPFWFPSVKHFLFSLPNNISLFFNAKCLFIVGNLIVFILIGESKLTQSSTKSPTSDIYDEYVARSRSNARKVNLNKEQEEESPKQSLKIVEKKHVNEGKIYHEEKKKEMRLSKSMHHHEEKKKGLRTSKSEVWSKREIVKREKTKGEKEEELYVPREELNKRVEAFIARVNKQRLLEAKIGDHIRG
ncbi:hypothetical protein BUALT_Bualt17G0015100 [Buddleja alternifolia]|uniref:DUF4408 domain-containing protein n=1 Tax=Buddleja alternifolia TaxID=168488 RepID=A0AAV6W6T2_9LAMI|nr:hypothetical protein BUALT_Bualt17G0015100 [Buddleja alternifolia]